MHSMQFRGKILNSRYRRERRAIRIMDSIKEQIFAYAKKAYGVEPDYPFPSAPEYPVLRHRESRKWFALFMDVPKNRLGLPGTERVDIINLKCGAVLSGALRMREGVLPAYHMHRESWITVLLDGTVPAEEIYPLVDVSFDMTSDKKRRVSRVDWLVPANPKYYDIEEGIRSSSDGTIIWKQSSKVAVGDTVYLYVAAPVSAVKYRFRAVEVDIPYRHAGGRINITRVMRLKLEKRYEKPAGRDVLRDHGVTTVRGPRYMPESLIEELDGPRRV